MILITDGTKSIGRTAGIEPVKLGAHVLFNREKSFKNQ